MTATESGLVISPPTLDAKTLALVKKTVANGATEEELELFLYDCRRQGVHPLDKLIHFTKRGGRYTPITSIDFMRMRAAETGELAGSDDPTFVFKDGEEVIPRSATVTVYRLTQGTRYAYTATARWAEYYPGKDQGFMWMRMPQLMLGKCAEALALRKAFPKQLHGLYERAEMMQAGAADDTATTAGPVGNSQGSRELVGSGSASAAAPEPSAEALFPKPGEPEERERLLAEMTRLGKLLKVKVDQWAQWRSTYLGSPNAVPQDAELSALADLVKFMAQWAGE